MATESEFNIVRACRYGTMIFNKNDWAIGYQLLHYGEWSESEMALLGTFLAPGHVVVDVGAHIGCHSLFFARCVGAEGHVHAFEPQRLLFQTLCGNMAINSLTNVTCHPFALGEREGSGTMQQVDHLASHNSGTARLEPDASGDDAVRIRTLDSLALPACRLIKIDVEGMERAVLEGGRETILRCRPYLYAENNQAEKSPALVALARSLSYTVYRHLAPSYNPDNFLRNDECYFKDYVEPNVLCVPSEDEAAFRPPEYLNRMP